MKMIKKIVLCLMAIVMLNTNVFAETVNERENAFEVTKEFINEGSLHEEGWNDVRLIDEKEIYSSEGNLLGYSYTFKNSTNYSYVITLRDTNGEYSVIEASNESVSPYYDIEGTAIYGGLLNYYAYDESQYMDLNTDEIVDENQIAEFEYTNQEKVSLYTGLPSDGYPTDWFTNGNHYLPHVYRNSDFPSIQQTIYDKPVFGNGNYKSCTPTAALNYVRYLWLYEDLEFNDLGESIFLDESGNLSNYFELIKEMRYSMKSYLPDGDTINSARLTYNNYIVPGLIDFFETFVSNFEIDESVTMEYTHTNLPSIVEIIEGINNGTAYLLTGGVNSGLVSTTGVYHSVTVYGYYLTSSDEYVLISDPLTTTKKKIKYITNGGKDYIYFFYAMLAN